MMQTGDDIKIEASNKNSLYTFFEGTTKLFDITFTLFNYIKNYDSDIVDERFLEKLKYNHFISDNIGQRCLEAIKRY